MKLFSYGKDGGPESHVWGFWLVEIKPLFSVVLLRFEDGTRSAYHDHAFNSISWLLRGNLLERFLGAEKHNWLYHASFFPIITLRSDFHQVESFGRSWVLSFRGPWRATWSEYIPGLDRMIKLTHGRKEVPR